MVRFGSNDDLGYRSIVGQMNTWPKTLPEQILAQYEISQTEEGSAPEDFSAKAR
jgi:hypothetical protein